MLLINVRSFTVMVMVPVAPPSTAVAVIVTSPGATAVTSPFSSTVAIVSSDELHVTSLLRGTSGQVLNVNFAVLSTSISVKPDG